MKRNLLLCTLFVLAGPGSLLGGRLQAQEPLDGPNRIFRDTLLDSLTGDWKLSRTIRGRSVESAFTAEWVLNHQFLRLHMKDVGDSPAYEAMVFIGYDYVSERYVAHWIDVGGGRFSEALGYGTRSGNSIKLVFE